MASMPRFKTKPHRLPAAAYTGGVTVSFTACEVRRQRMFESETIVKVCLQVLREETSRFRCDVPVYCFMPDHLHVVLNGLDAKSRPKGAMERFKQQTGLWLAANASSFEWQDDFHDHIIRKHDDWRRHVQYIAFNPVRAGIVENPLDYPFTGAIGHDLGELLFDSIL
jgi:putative transposase